MGSPKSLGHAAVGAFVRRMSEPEASSAHLLWVQADAAHDRVFSCFFVGGLFARDGGWQPEHKPQTATTAHGPVGGEGGALLKATSETAMDNAAPCARHEHEMR